MTAQQQIEHLEESLNRASNKKEIEGLFVDYCNGMGSSRLVNEELFNMIQDVTYSVPNFSNKLSWTILNNNKYNYTLDFCLPGENLLPPITWTGNSQILTIKGTGTARIQKIQVPTEVNINEFRVGIQSRITQELICREGEFVTNWNDHNIIAVTEVTGPVVVELLSIKNTQSDFHWKFNRNLSSIDATSSKLFIARLMTIVNLAIEMEQDIPQRICDTIFEFGDPFIKFKVIEAMLLEQHDSALHRLESAIHYKNSIISSRASHLYNQIINHK